MYNIGERQYGFALDVRPGKEAEAEAMRLEQRGQNNDGNISNECEKDIVNNLV